MAAGRLALSDVDGYGICIRKSEHLYDGYSRILLGLSLTAPICLGVLSIPAVNQGTMVLGWICMDRLLGSPIDLSPSRIYRHHKPLGRFDNLAGVKRQVFPKARRYNLNSRA